MKTKMNDDWNYLKKTLSGDQQAFKNVKQQLPID